jgi:hypothetical protein
MMAEITKNSHRVKNQSETIAFTQEKEPYL